MFSRLQINGWRQFGAIDLDIHPRLTIITGANGAGKSTLLSMFTRHFGYSRNLYATPSRKDGITVFSFGFFDWLKGERQKRDLLNSQLRIGSITYSGGYSTPIRIPAHQGLQYQLNFDNQLPVTGLHIDSHRPPSVYRHISQIPTQAPDVLHLSNVLNGEAVSYYNSGNVQMGALHHIKLSLMQMSIFGHGNGNMPAMPELLTLYEGFERKLSEILPPSLGFKGLIIQTPEILLSTNSGDFIIDGASGGIIKLIEIAWQIYFFSLQHERFVVTFDEPENHLHPSMQKSFLPRLMNAFPGAQMIVVTHSPFIITALQDSHVYVLRYEAGNYSENDDDALRSLRGEKVYSERLDTINKAADASEILREVLGVSTTLPDWADNRVRVIADKYRGKDFDSTTLESLEKEMTEAGLYNSYPDALKMVVSDQ